MCVVSLASETSVCVCVFVFGGSDVMGPISTQVFDSPQDYNNNYCSELRLPTRSSHAYSDLHLPICHCDSESMICLSQDEMLL